MQENKKTIYSFIGLPASGKGTQAKILASKENIQKIVGIGDLVREVMASDPANSDPFINQIKERYNNGIPQPDSVAIDLVKQYLGNSTGDVIFDNFPFTVGQAKFIESYLRENSDWEKHFVIYIKVDPEQAINRAIMRKVCTNCGAIFGAIDSMICEKCGGPLVVRADDNEDTMRTRIEHYLPKIKEVIEFYKTLGGNVLEINGDQSIADVSAEIDSKLS